MGGLQLLNFIVNAGGVPSIAQGADAAKPTTAATGALYCADDTNIIYYWNGSAWTVLINGGVTGSYINNSLVPQNPGTYNIVGQGQILNGATDPPGGTFAQLLQNITNFPTVAPASGSLTTSENVVSSVTFTGTIAIPNSATLTGIFSRMRLQSTSSGTITVNQGASGQKRAIGAVVANVYLPSLAAGINSTVTDVAAFVALAPYQDGGTTNSEKITNYYGLLLPPSDEQLSFAAITNKFGVNQDGANDQNIFKGPLRFNNTALLNSNSNYFLQTDGSGNVSIQPAYTFSALTTYAGTIAWTGTTPPSGTANLSYRWSQTGNLVTVQISLFYSVAGLAITQVSATLPAGLPAQSQPTGTPTNVSQPVGSGTFYNYIAAGSFQQVGICVLRYDGKIQANFSSIAILGVQMQLQYYTS